MNHHEHGHWHQTDPAFQIAPCEEHEHGIDPAFELGDSDCHSCGEHSAHHFNIECGHEHRIFGTNITLLPGDFVYWDSNLQNYLPAVENHCDLMVLRVDSHGTWFEAANIGEFQIKDFEISGSVYLDSTGKLTNTETNTKIGFIEEGHIYLSIQGASSGGEPYTLPIASPTVLGGIKVGDNLSIEEDGTLNATGGGGVDLPIIRGSGTNSIVYNDPLETDRATGLNANSFGNDSEASGENAFATGWRTSASGHTSHTEGYGTSATQYTSHAEGYSTSSENFGSHSEGNLSIARGFASHAEGNVCIANDQGSHAEGSRTEAYQQGSHSEGDQTIASGYSSHAEGFVTIASEQYAHAEGQRTTASGGSSHAEGLYCTASAEGSHAEGDHSIALGRCSHVEGIWNEELAGTSHNHVEGNLNSVASYGNHVEGYGNNVSSSRSHVEGSNNIVTGNDTHTEGNDHTNKGLASHAEGVGHVVNSDVSHVEGSNNISSINYQHIQGQFAEDDTGYSGDNPKVDKIGWGGGDSYRKDISWIRADGTIGTSAHAVGSGTASLGSNCPAIDPSTPYAWLKFELDDGTIGYVPFFR